MDEGCIAKWSDRDDFEEEATADSYECWLRDAYFENHFKVTIEEVSLCICADSFASIGKAYMDSRFRADFEDQIECWEEISDLTPEQYAEMVAQPSVPETIQKQLKQNGYLEESYWESVSEAAFKIVNAYTQRINAGGAQ